MKKYLMIVLFIFGMLILVGCGETQDTPKELTELEKIQLATPKDATSYTVETLITYKSIKIYEENLTYIKNDDKFEVTGTVKELNPLSEKNEYKVTTIDEERDAKFAIDLQDAKYANWTLTLENTIYGVLTEEGCKAYAIEGATDASITVKANDGKVLEIVLDYVYNGQYVSVKAVYSY